MKILRIIEKYIENLMISYQEFINDWDFFQNFDRIYLGDISIDKFLLSGHHKNYHCDRDSIDNSHKMLSWFTFLNDTDENERYCNFKYLNINIRPTKRPYFNMAIRLDPPIMKVKLKIMKNKIIRGNIHYQIPY